MLTKSKYFNTDLSIFIANALDHFDIALYTLLIPVLGPVFFANADPSTNLIFGYSVLTTAFLTKPLGSLIFGIIASQKGPLLGLSYSLIGASLTTLLFAALPTHNTAGHWSWILLILVRFLRGIFTAGESTIAKLHVMEGKHKNQEFRASYYYPTSSMLGMTLASFVSYFFLERWRYCFVLGGLIGLFGLFMRTQAMDPTPDQAREQVDLKNILSLLKNTFFFKENQKKVFKIFLTTGLSHITAILPFSLLNGIVPLLTVNKITLETMLLMNSGFLLIDLILIPLLGYYVIKFSPNKILAISAGVLGLSLPILFFYINHESSIYYIMFVRLWIIFWGVVFVCPLNLYYKKLFEQNSKEQYLILGLATALGSSVIGKLSPIFLMWLYLKTKSVFYMGVYSSIIALICLLFI